MKEVQLIGRFIQKQCIGSLDYLFSSFLSLDQKRSKLTLFHTVLWSYDGWECLAYVSEEMKNPKRDYKPAIYISMILTTSIYVFINITYLTVMTPAEIITSDAVAIVFSYRTLGKFAWIIPIGVAVSTFGSSNGSVTVYSRISNTAGRRSHLPRIMSYLDTKFHTPTLSLIINACSAIVFISLPGSTWETALDYFSIVAYFFYGLCQFGVIILRYKKPYSEWKRDFKVPLILPIITTLISFYVVFVPLYLDFSLGYFLIILLPIASLVFYVPMKCNGWKGFHFMNKLELVLQKILRLAPRGKFV